MSIKIINILIYRACMFFLNDTELKYKIVNKIIYTILVILLSKPKIYKTFHVLVQWVLQNAESS